MHVIIYILTEMAMIVHTCMFIIQTPPTASHPLFYSLLPPVDCSVGRVISISHSSESGSCINFTVLTMSNCSSLGGHKTYTVKFSVQKMSNCVKKIYKNVICSGKNKRQKFLEILSVTRCHCIISTWKPVYFHSLMFIFQVFQCLVCKYRNTWFIWCLKLNN